jgi:hypothetical protein
VENLAPKSLGYFCKLQKLLKVNNPPMGENVPNLVTLTAMQPMTGLLQQTR